MIDPNKSHAVASQLHNDMLFHKINDALLRACAEVHSGDQEEGKAIVRALFEVFAKRGICLVGEEDYANLHKSLSRTARNRDMWKAQVDRQAKKISEMRKALKPFADEAENWFEMGDTRPIIDTLGITVGDLRSAREAAQ